MYYINNSEMICIPFTLEHARNIVSSVASTFGLIMGVIASSMFVVMTNTVSNSLAFAKYIISIGTNTLTELSSEEVICIAFGFTTLMFTLILKVNVMLLNDIFKKIAYLTKENDMKTEKIEMLIKQIENSNKNL